MFSYFLYFWFGIESVITVALSKEANVTGDMIWNLLRSLKIYLFLEFPSAMRFMMVMFPLVGFTITNSNFFQSIDKPWIAIVTSLSRQVLFLAPMIYIIPPLFVNMGGLGLTGVWASMTISDMMGALLAFVLMLSQRKVFRPTA